MDSPMYLMRTSLRLTPYSFESHPSNGLSSCQAFCTVRFRFGNDLRPVSAELSYSFPKKVQGTESGNLPLNCPDSLKLAVHQIAGNRDSAFFVLKR
jgi:hypothetical protein